MTQFQFFSGKAGVGKIAISCVSAIERAVAEPLVPDATHA